MTPNEQKLWAATNQLLPRDIQFTDHGRIGGDGRIPGINLDQDNIPQKEQCDEVRAYLAGLDSAPNRAQRIEYALRGLLEVLEDTFVDDELQDAIDRAKSALEAV